LFYKDFDKAKTPGYQNFVLKVKKFKLCFNIGSNWGPRFLAGRGEHVDLVPLLGNGVVSLLLINCQKVRTEDTNSLRKSLTARHVTENQIWSSSKFFFSFQN
jgi:hypothetical protein